MSTDSMTFRIDGQKQVPPLRWGWALLAGVLLCYWCWYNGFPFVYSDTGTYIFSGLDGFVPDDRPLAYGLFIRHISMKESLIWVVLAQGILTAMFIAWWMQHVGKISHPVAYTGMVLFLILCTHVSIYVSFLMPDFFTPIFYGCVVLLLTTPLKGKILALLLPVGWYAAMSHNAHLIAGTLIAMLMTVARLTPTVRQWLPWRRLAILWGFVAASWLGILLMHYTFSGKMKIMQAGPVFMLARMNEFGLLKQYLDEACAQGKDYKICADKDAIPADFLWNPASPSQKYGGWLANKAEYTAIQTDILTTPKFFKRWLVQALNGGLKQFFFFRTEDLYRQDEKAPASQGIRIHFSQEFNAYTYCHQNGRSHLINFEGTNARQLFLFFGCILIAVLLACSKKWRTAIPPLLVRVYFLVLLCLVLNAFLSSTFSTVVSRYQGRLLWLWILTGAMVVGSWWPYMKASAKTFISPKNAP